MSIASSSVTYWRAISTVNSASSENASSSASRCRPVRAWNPACSISAAVAVMFGSALPAWASCVPQMRSICARIGSRL